jgi:hypothetical protein
MDNRHRAALVQGHVQGIEDELGAQVCGHGPAHHAAAEGVDQHQQEQETRPGRDIGVALQPAGDPGLRR